jgi:hypothetical protein
MASRILTIDRLVGRMVSVAMLIERVERGPDAGAVRALDLAHADRHLQREFLADITQVEMDLTLRARCVAEARGGFRDHLVMDLRQRGEVDGGEIGIERADEIMPFVRQQHPQRGEM